MKKEELNFMFLDYPSLWFQQPYFHPDRPRYYKDTLFGVFLSYSVNHGLQKYMKLNKIPSRNGDKNHFDFISLIFKNYAKWDDEENKDQPLPGFLFSNKQIFWFTLIHKNCIKLRDGKSHVLNSINSLDKLSRFQRSSNQQFSMTNLMLKRTLGKQKSFINYLDAIFPNKMSLIWRRKNELKDSMNFIEEISIRCSRLK